MKVFNITDDPTPALKGRGLVNVSLQAGFKVIRPGESAEIPDRFVPGFQKYVNCKALALGSLPKDYKSKQSAEAVPPVKAGVAPKPPTTPTPVTPPAEPTPAPPAPEPVAAEAPKAESEAEPAPSKKSGKKKRKKG